MIKKPFYSIFQGEFNDYAFDVDCNQQSECCRTLPVDYNQHRMHVKGPFMEQYIKNT